MPYQRRGPSTRTVTNPASRSTRRCLDVTGWVSPSVSASSPTSCSPLAEAVEDRPPDRLRQHLERCEHVDSMPYEVYA